MAKIAVRVTAKNMDRRMDFIIQIDQPDSDRSTTQAHRETIKNRMYGFLTTYYNFNHSEIKIK